MLFAVEGGGFFSSSAQGYSKGLALLLLGRTEERPMKITPWSQYQFVEQEAVPDFQLASRKSTLNHRCASFICFGRASGGTDSSFPPKVGPLQHPQNANTLASDKIVISSSNDNDIENKACRKSCLKKSSEIHSVMVGNVHEPAQVESASRVTDKRKVQWGDDCGRELVQIREFECSGEDTSDDEYENGGKKCVCVIQ